MRGHAGAATLLAVAALIVYLSNARMHASGDGTSHLLTAASWLHQGNADLDEYAGRALFRSIERGGHAYLPYTPGLGLLVLPGVAMLDLAGVAVTDLAATALLSKLLGTLFAAASVAFVFLACARVAREGAALLATLAYAFATSVWSVSSQLLFQHAPSQFLIAAGTYLVVRGGRVAALSAIPLSLAVAVRPTNAFFALFGALAVARLGRRELTRYLAWSLPAAAFLLAYNAVAFGHPLETGYGPAGWRFSPEGYLGLLFAPSRGLLVYSPYLLLGLVALARAWRGRSRQDVLLRDASLAVLGVWLLYGSYEMWWGGWAYGNRYLSDALPLLSLGVALAIERGGLHSLPARILFAAALTWSAVLHFAGAAYYYQYWNGEHWDATVNIDLTPWRLWDLADPQWLFVLRHLLAEPDAALASALVGVALAAVLVWRVGVRSLRTAAPA